MPRMEEEQIEERIGSGPKHWSSGWLGALLAFVIPLLVIAYFLGIFAKPTVTVTETGPYRYVYLPFQGGYYQVDERLQDLEKSLKLARVPHGGPMGVFYDDPRQVPERARRARAGYFLAPDTPVPADMQVDSIPRRRVVMVQVKAHPAIAPIKAYRALDQWLQANGLPLAWPTLERYGPNKVVTVEMGL